MTGARFKRRRAALRPQGPRRTLPDRPFAPAGHEKGGWDERGAGARPASPHDRQRRRAGRLEAPRCTYPCQTWCLLGGCLQAEGRQVGRAQFNGRWLGLSAAALSGRCGPQTLRYAAQTPWCAAQGPRQGLAAVAGDAPQTGSVTTLRRPSARCKTYKSGTVITWLSERRGSERLVLWERGRGYVLRSFGPEFLPIWRVM